MRCSRCGHENKEGAKFCNECGNRLDAICASCSAPNPPGSKFCSECGTSLVASAQLPVASPQPPSTYTPKHLAERILAEQAAMEARGTRDGERKTITALFADLAGFTALARDLDPEDTRRIIDPALQLMMDAVHRYEGYVAQSLGDGIFALFGAPIAHEDHPQRAVFAALRMQDEMRRYADKIRSEKGVPLQMRVGINSGEVVLRSIRKDDLHTDYVPVGHSTNLASRMEGLAAPGTIVISEHTHKLIEGYFDCKSLGAVQVKGLEEPVRIYEVGGVGPLRTKLQVAARRGLARFIGRLRELDLLKGALAQAQAGHGQIVGVMGEPGVGKSRLFYEFKIAAQTGCLLLETFSVSHGKAYAYLPLIDLLGNYFQFTTHDDDRKRREKITGKVLTLDRSLEDLLPYLFYLLGIAEPTSPLQQMDAQIRRQRTLEAIKRLLVRESLNQPLIIIFEDLHWLDTETQAFLSLLSESLATAKILLLVNYRPEYQHTWGSKTYYTQVRLDPLGWQEAEEMLTALLEEKVGTTHALSLRDLQRFILEKTEGNPFFMEEIVQTLVEQGVLGREPSVGVGAALRGRPEEGTHIGVPLHGKSLADLHLPPTVQAVLASRIDRLPLEEKNLLQTLAVIGKEFSLGLLRQVVDHAEDTLHRLLAHLREAEFIYEQPAFPEPEYTFKHALTQEVAYNSLLIERRKSLHERTAQAIESLFHPRLEDHYSELAQHYSRSGNVQKAVEYLQRAGQQAVQRSANLEAISHLTAALEFLTSLPAGSERDQRELLLQTTLGPALIATRGYAAPEVGRAYTRARELCQQLGESAQLFPVLMGMWTFLLIRGELRAARELGEQLVAHAQRAQDSGLLVEAHWALGESVLLLGDPVQARVSLERGIALYDRQQHGAHAVLYGQDPGVTCRVFFAWAVWLLGYPEQAYQKCHDALALARELSHLNTEVFALLGPAWVDQASREAQATQRRIEVGMTFATEHGLPFWLAMAEIYRGWALAKQGQREEGIAQIHQGLADYRATGAEGQRSLFLVFLADACMEGARVGEGLSAIAEALALVEGDKGDRTQEVELYRLKGELTLQQFQVSGSKFQIPNTQHLTPNTQAEAEAEACFLKAIEIARKQQAKSLELRAVMSLARLWQQQGKREDARKMLAEVYDWFTEGFDTKDLQEAKALLAELNGQKRPSERRKKGQATPRQRSRSSRKDTPEV